MPKRPGDFNSGGDKIVKRIEEKLQKNTILTTYINELVNNVLDEIKDGKINEEIKRYLRDEFILGAAYIYLVTQNDKISLPIFKNE